MLRLSLTAVYSQYFMFSSLWFIEASSHFGAAARNGIKQVNIKLGFLASTRRDMVTTQTT